MKQVFRISVFLFIVLTAAAFAGSGQLPASCKHCSMRLDPAQARFSVEITQGIEPSVFDDIGCALRWRKAECAMRTSAFDSYARVRDFRTGEPVLMEQAYFVQKSGIKTPMGYDIAAFAMREAAETLVKEQGAGAVLTFGQLCSARLE